MALAVAAVILAATVAYTVIGLLVSSRPERVVALVAGASVICVVTAVLVRVHHEAAAATIATAGIWAVSFGSIWTGGGLQAPSVALQCAFVAVAALLLGRRAALGALGFSLATVLALAWAERAGLLPLSMMRHTPVSRAGVLGVAILMVGAIVLLAAEGQRRAMRRAAHELAERTAAEAALRRRVAELDSLQQLSQLLAGSNDLRPALDEAGRLLAELFDAGSVDIQPVHETDDLVETSAGGQLGVTDSPDGLRVPLAARGELLGALCIVRRESAPFTLRERAVAETAGKLVAAAMMNERLRVLETQAAAVGERQRIARDLHDAVAQDIYSANLIAETLPEVWAQCPADGQRELLLLRRVVRSALGEMRTVLYDLRPESLPLTPLPLLLARLSDALVGRGEIEVSIDVDQELTLPPDVHVACYRIAQEAFNNVGKHAQATHVRAVVRRAGDSVRLMVCDDGKGFDATQTRAGMGTSIMDERAREIGAQLKIESALGGGTTVSLLWAGDGAQAPSGDRLEAGVRAVCTDAGRS